MSPQPLNFSDNYLASVRGLRELHSLIASGDGDSPEADALRESLEAPWYRMTDEEQARVNRLSEDLYSISASPQPPLKMTAEAEAHLLAVEAARNIGDWDRAFSVLRDWGKYLPSGELAVLRGQIWLDAGDSETAALFLDHAAALDPSTKGVDAISFLPHSVPGRS